MLSLAELRDREFARLTAQGHAYLDYTGSALYGASQIRAHHALLAEGLFGNPHSDSQPSRRSTEVLDSARRRVLQFLDADPLTYDVLFTANTTAAIKLVAESYPFAPGSALVLSTDNHNSVNGMREYARRAGARVRLLPLDEELRLAGTAGCADWPSLLQGSRQSAGSLSRSLPGDPQSILIEEGGGLLAFPAQSNFSGVRHPLSLVARAQALGFDVLLDIAAYVPNQAFSLRQCPADFAALSFYKLFGYPTGVGALVARRDALARLRRPWFAGGTVTYASVAADRHRLRPEHEGFEDGTPNFLGIAALEAGFALLEEAGMARLSAHVGRLTRRFIEQLTKLGNVRIYGPANMVERGGAVTFNLTDGVGEVIPYAVVETAARNAGVALRGGCFCNPGASEAAFGLDGDRLASCLEAIDADFSVERFSACTGTPVGAVRASFGLATNEDDLRRAVEVLAELSTPLRKCGLSSRA